MPRFEIRSEFTDAFRSDHFDLFPGPIGKLLNAPGEPGNDGNDQWFGGLGVWVWVLRNGLN